MFNSKRNYIEPEAEIVNFGSEDIITASSEDNDPFVEDDFE